MYHWMLQGQNKFSSFSVILVLPGIPSCFWTAHLEQIGETPSHVHFTEDGGFFQNVMDILWCLDMKLFPIHPWVFRGIVGFPYNLSIPFVCDDHIHDTIVTTSRFHITNYFLLAYYLTSVNGLVNFLMVFALV